MAHRTTAAAVLLVAAVALTGCGSDDQAADPDSAAPSETASSAPADPTTSPAEQSPTAEETPSPEPAPEPAAITISSFTYEVPETVSPGQTITVTNQDEVLHTVTADDGGFDVQVPAGATVDFTVPSEPGRYPFFCDPHPYMTATLVVG